MMMMMMVVVVHEQGFILQTGSDSTLFSPPSSYGAKNLNMTSFHSKIALSWPL
jgi:hypothetical protein